MDWMDSIEQLKGIGPASLARFKQLNIETIQDLLFHFPFRYENIQERDIETILDQEKVVLKGKIISDPVVSYYGRRKSRLSCRLAVDSQTLITVVFFNQPYLVKQLELGNQVAILGKWQQSRQTLMGMKIIQRSHTNDLEPIYSTVKGLSQSLISKSVYQAFELYGKDIPEILPESLNLAYRLMPLNQALYRMHFPKSAEHYHQAERKIIYQEFFLYQWRLMNQAEQWEKYPSVQYLDRTDRRHQIQASLPFELTSSQQQALDEIMHDLYQPYPMRRMLQGDVGSGKTIVAFLAMIETLSNDLQAALMVPTEILARQHVESFNQLFQSYGFQAELLVSSMERSEKERVIQAIASGECQIVIGTHALIQDSVQFKRLGLAIIDEQHRFGVNQRHALMAKGPEEVTINILQMTATPIPRTLAQAIYQGMAVSTIDQMPQGRLPIQTEWIQENQINRVYQRIHEQLSKGHQVYYVLPLINPSDALEEVESVQSVAQRLADQFPQYRIGYLHGQLDKESQRETMEGFVNHHIDILIATTMVEVGVSVSNATVMVVQSAERFGLSQLHQLRGRVGRGQWQSYCYLIANPKTDAGKQRMQIMAEQSDGFLISEADMALRGMGDVLGISQSGLPDFHYANLIEDQHIYRVAKEDVEQILSGQQPITPQARGRLDRLVEANEMKL
ncbi:ATP-dependent DNA helicase RecG [Falseniella ignava CCUG 37419]|uniref:ATP-dependent DNA helicase RecG n=2 Tax=Falseniella ignava TaxID=137730 RepID=K1M5X2_9LACT|nr:ATP-dependent DNA helicase RecG [Falseniella ignava CCUG 37419]